MFALDKILLPVDFSPACMGAVRYAKSLASRFGSQLILLHVTVPLHFVGGPEVGPYPVAEFRTEKLDREKEQLETFMSQELTGMDVSRILEEGDPARKIVEFAHAKPVNLIVMPTHGYGPFRRFLLGSVVAKVLHDTDCPVWTGLHLEEAPGAEPISFQKIACAVNLGGQSEAVVAWASGMAAAFGAQLSLIHATPSLEVVVAESPEPDRASDEIRALQQKVDTAAEVNVESGDAVQVVYDFAARLPADLLVIGRGSSKGVIGRLRDKAYTIIRESPCPVVSV